MQSAETASDSARTASAGDAIRLSEWTACGGCAAKWGAGSLRELVAAIASGEGAGGAGGSGGGLHPDVLPPDVLVGLAPFDDAAVVRLTDDVALVSTTDFFPPLVDDPSDFGAIAAANACSDVLAMGGHVRLALNIAAFPEEFPHQAIAAIFASASGVVAAAGGVIAGGHTIRSREPIFGLAVQGVVHPDRIWTKAGACPGDVLVLSKPLGTGIVLGGGGEVEKRAAIDGMRALNVEAANQLRALGDAVHAVTDVTGFGLLGHAWEMVDQTPVHFAFDADALPFYRGAVDIAGRGVRTGADERNRDAVAADVYVSGDVSDRVAALCFDPQTSGGLLASVSRESVARLPAFSVIGEVSARVAGSASVSLARYRRSL